MQVSKEMWEFLLGEVLWAYFRQVLTRENSPSSVLTVRFRAKAEVKLITVILVGKTATFFSPSLFMVIYSEVFHICFSSLAASSWHLSLVMKMGLRDMAEATKCPGLWVTGCCWPWGSPSRGRCSCGITVWPVSALGLQCWESGAFPNCWNSLRRR